MNEDKNQFAESNPLFKNLPKNPNGSLVPAEIPESILGEDFIGTGETEIEAMREADKRACAHARSKGTCFHPSRLYPRRKEGTIWIAKANAANQPGSCPNLDRDENCWTWEY